MKYIYSFIFATVIFQLQSQTLTQAFNEPVVNDIDKNYRLDTSAYTSGMPVNTSGSSCVWNFSNLVAIFPMVVDSFIAPAAAPGHTAFPGASFVQHRDNIYTYYASNASQQTELLGGYSPSLTLTFTNTAIIASYPISYGYSSTDPVSGSFKYNSTNGACNGNIHISAAGTGTLNFPNSISIPNVLCLKSVEILTLSAGILPFGTFNQTIYNYYVAGKKFPILNVNYTIYQLLAGTPTITAFVNGTTDYFTVAGIQAQQLNKEDYRAFPNPFHDRVFIQPKQLSEDTRYLLYDMNGRTVFETKDLTAQETAALLPGVYVLEIKNKSGTLHQKVIKD